MTEKMPKGVKHYPINQPINQSIIYSIMITTVIRVSYATVYFYFFHDGPVDMHI